VKRPLIADERAGATGVLTARHGFRVRDSPAWRDQHRRAAGPRRRDVLSQPFAVAGRHEHVLPAVQEQDRDGDVGEVESPRLEHALVVPPSLAARRQPILRAGQKELVKLAVPDLEGRICRRECRLDLPGRSLGV
jgi:hypothetical protein